VSENLNDWSEFLLDLTQKSLLVTKNVIYSVLCGSSLLPVGGGRTIFYFLESESIKPKKITQTVEIKSGS
jgi:hypothetical protein